MAKALCACGIYTLETEHASYVRDGVPMCNAFTCSQVRLHPHAIRVLTGRDPGDESDQLPSEIYAR